MKKGFTLVELLATVILLGALIIIAYPKIIDMAEKKQKEIEKNKLELIYNAADTYISNNSDNYPKKTGAKYCVSISELETENLVPVDISEYSEKFLAIKIGKKNSYVIMENNCPEDQYISPPVITSFVPIEKKYQEIKVQASADGTASPITKYEFAIDGGNYVDNGTTNIYTYTGVTSGEHKLKVKITNEAGFYTEKELIGERSHVNITMSLLAQTNTSFTSNTLSYYGDTSSRVLRSGAINLTNYSSVNLHVRAYVSAAGQGSIHVKMGISTDQLNSYTTGFGTVYTEFDSTNVIGGPYTERYYTWSGNSTASRYLKLVTNRSQANYNGNVYIVKAYAIPKV